LKNKLILICCINSESYGGLTYWVNFIKSIEKSSKNIKIDFKYIVNEDSKISKLINIKDKIVVKKIIYKSFYFRFIYEQFYIPLYLFKNHKADFFFNGKNIAPIFILNKSIIAIRNIEPFFYYKINFSLRKFKSFLRFILSIISIKYCHTIISVSKNTTKIIKKHSKKKIYLIPNGVSVKKKYQNNWKINKSKNFLLNSSKFIPYANQFRLLQIYKNALKKNSGIPPLYFAGGVVDKPYYKKILRFVKDNKLNKNIKFLGYISKNKLHSLMVKCKLFLFSSELESCPQTVLEAQLIGCPILSSKIQPMPEFLKNSAFYFNIYNKESSTKKLNHIINLSKQKILYLKKKKRPNENKYLWSKVILTYLNIFKKICAL